MPLISRPNYNLIFASQAPEEDKPAVFNNYPLGWGVESRPNNGKPTIKGFNFLQQSSDLRDLYIVQNGACLPYDESIEYAEGALVLKDGAIQQYNGTTWSAYRNETPYTLKYFTDGTSYPANAEITLTNGEKVKNVSGGSLTNDPNADLTGWVRVNAASQIYDTSGQTQQQVNDEVSDKSNLYADVLDSELVSGDGVASDSTGLQAYANGLQLAKNTTTFIPMRDKNYRLTAPLVYQEPCMILGDKAPSYNRGQGSNGWLLVDSSAGYAIDLGNQRTYNTSTTNIATKQSQNPADQFTVKNIGIRNAPGTTPRTVSGIKHTARTDGPDRGLRIIEASFDRLDKAIWISNQGLSTQIATLVVEGCVASICNYAVFAEGNTLGARIVGNQFEQNLLGAIHGTFNGGVTIEDNMLEGQPNTINITIPAITGNRPKVSIARNYFEANSGEYLIKVNASAKGHITIEDNYHFNTNNVSALTDVVVLSGSFEYIRNTDDFLITFDKSFFVEEDSFISRYGNFRVYFGTINKGGLYNSIFSKYEDCRLIDPSYAKSNVVNYSRVVDTDMGRFLYNQTANNFVSAPLSVAVNDCIVLHVAYFDDSVTTGEDLTTIQVFNNNSTVTLAEGSLSIPKSCGKIKIATFHFTSAGGSTNLQVRFLSRSDLKILGVAAKKLGVFDGSTTVRYNSMLAAPLLTKLSDVVISATYDPPSIAAAGNAGSSVSTTISALGLKVGDVVSATFDQYNANIDVSAVVSAPDTITVRFKNNSAAPIDLPSGTVAVKLA